MPVRTRPASAASGSRARGSVRAGRARIASNFAFGQRTPSATKERMRTAVAAHAKSQPGIARSVAPPMPWADAASGRARTKPVRSAARPARRGVRVMSYVFVRRRRAGERRGPWPDACCDARSTCGVAPQAIVWTVRRARPATEGRFRQMGCGLPHRVVIRVQTGTLRRVKKTSIYLEPELDEALARRAADEGLTKAEFIRRTLAGAVQRPRRSRPTAVGLHDDRPRDLAARDEHHFEPRA